LALVGPAVAPAGAGDIVQHEASLDPAGWHPLLAQLYRYWQSLRGPAGELPGRQHIDPMAIKEHLPAIWLLDVELAPFRLRYRLVGTKIDQMTGMRLTSRWMTEAHPHIAGQTELLARFEHVVERGTPSWKRGRPLFWYDKATTVENIVLPLARDGARVDVLLIETRFFGADGTEL
jgi:hypothetical protein